MRPAPARFPIIALPSRRTVAVVLLAVVAATIVWRITARASATAAALGTTTPVWVAEQSLDAGEVIEPGDVVLAERPRAFVPRDAVDDDPTGLSARAGIAAGEVVVDDRVAEHGDGPAALIPSGWRGVAVPTYEARPPVEPGSLVDVVVTVDPALGDGGGVLVADAVVIHVDENGDTVTVAVPADDVPALAAAQIAGVVTLALSG